MREGGIRRQMKIYYELAVKYGIQGFFFFLLSWMLADQPTFAHTNISEKRKLQTVYLLMATPQYSRAYSHILVELSTDLPKENRFKDGWAAAVICSWIKLNLNIRYWMRC
jgi:hypothetical protein